MASFWNRLKAAVSIGNANSWSKPDAISKKEQAKRVNAEQLQRAIQTAKYGVLANNPQKQKQLIQSVQPTKFNPISAGASSAINVVKSIPASFVNTAQTPYSLGRMGVANVIGNKKAAANARKAFQSDANNNLFTPVTPFAKSVAAAGMQPVSNFYANRESKRAKKQLTPAYEALYKAYGQDPRQGANQADLESDLVKQQFLQDQLQRAGLNQNDSLRTTSRKIGAQGAQTGLTLTSLGKMPTFASARAAAPLIKDLTLMGGLGAASNVAATAQQDKASSMDYLKSGATGFATGVALPAAIAGAGALVRGGVNSIKTVPTAGKTIKVSKPNPRPVSNASVGELRQHLNTLQKRWDTASPQSRKQIEKAIKEVNKAIKDESQRGGAKNPLYNGSRTPQDKLVSDLLRQSDSPNNALRVSRTNGKLAYDNTTGLPMKFDSPEVKVRMMKDYIEGRPPIKGSALSGEGARVPGANMSKQAQQTLMDRVRARVGIGNQSGKILGPEDSPIIKKLTGSRLGKEKGNVQARQNLQENSLIPSKKLSRGQSPDQLPKEALTNVNKTASSKKGIPQVAEDVQNILAGQKIKERGFAATVKGSAKTPKQLGDIENGTYVIKSDKQRINDARNFIRNDSVKAEQLALNPRTDMDVTIGNQLIDHYIATGQLAKMKNLVSGMSESGTELGRAIHAFADYDKTTPSGAVKFAEKTIKAYNKANPNKKIDLSTDNINSLVKKARDIQDMPEGKARNIASHQLMTEVNNLIPSTIADKAITVWKAGLLTSPRTTMRNLIGNSVHAITENIKDIPAAINDAFLSGRTGKRTLTATSRGALSGAKEGVGVGKDLMRYGYDPGDAISKYDVKHVTWGDNSIERGLKKYTDFVFNTMGAQDKPFYHSAFARSLYDQAGAEAINAGKRGNRAFIEKLVKNPTETMKLNATKDASLATFKNENKLREIAGQFKQTMGKSEAGKVISEVVAPFTGVPSSIAGQIIQYSPIGLARGIAKDAKVLAKNLPELQRQASQEIGRGVVGTGILGLGAYLTTQGLMTGNPKSPEEARQWELEGKQANSVFIGGKWRSINSIGPEALVALAGSKIASGVKNKDDTSTIASNIGKDFTQQTFLAGVQGPLNAVADPARYGGTYRKSTAASIVPNIVKDTAKAFDGTQRETNSVKDALQASIPFARNKLLPKRDALGTPLKQEPTGVSAYVDLFNSKTPKNNPVINELTRLDRQGQNALPSKQANKTSIGGVKVELTDKQRNKLQENTGNDTRKGYDNFIKTQQYKNLTDETKKKVLEDYYSDINTTNKYKLAASDQIGPYAPGSKEEPKKLTARQQKVMDGTITIDDYIPKESKKSARKAKISKSSKLKRGKSKRVRGGRKKSTVSTARLVRIPGSRVRKAPSIRLAKAKKAKFATIRAGKAKRVKINA